MKGFPFQYLGEMVYYHPGEMDEKALSDKIWSTLAVLPDQQNRIHFNQGPFFFASPVQIEIKVDPIVVHVVYRISLTGLNLSLLIGLLFCLFVQVMGYPSSAWTFLSLLIISYVVVLIIQSSYLQEKINRALDLPPFEGEAALWHKQKEWMQQPEHCPACGEIRNIYSEKCVSCELKLPPVKGQKTIETNATSTGEITFTYEYKK
jgi:hypothetical protein